MRATRAAAEGDRRCSRRSPRPRAGGWSRRRRRPPASSRSTRWRWTAT
ncbi:MAG: hypothetical protein MZW92_55590 [Comamonadaceae bacterium]|nr:hypothetical protein [Comamonadaceae bacterium]